MNLENKEYYNGGKTPSTGRYRLKMDKQKNQANNWASEEVTPNFKVSIEACLFQLSFGQVQQLSP